MKKFSIQDVIPEGKQIMSSPQDGVLLTYITQVISITTNLKSNGGVALFQEPKWVGVSDNFATSIGPEKARQHGTDIFLLYLNNLPMLARIDGQSVLALDPASMEARYAVAKQIMEDMYKSLPKDLTEEEKAAVSVESAPETPKKTTSTRKPAATKKPSTSKKPKSDA